MALTGTELVEIRKVSATGTPASITTQTTTQEIADLSESSPFAQAQFSDFIVSPQDTSGVSYAGLTVSMPESSISYLGSEVTLPAISNYTVQDNYITDWWADDTGAFTVATVSSNDYTNATRYADPYKIHVWRVYSANGLITSVVLMSNRHTVEKLPADRAGTLQQFFDDYWINTDTDNYVGGGAVTYGQLIKTTAGLVYQVTVAGNVSMTEPTSTASGAIISGTATLNYYCDAAYLGMFRQSPSAGVENYFINIGLFEQVHKTTSTHIDLAEKIKDYIKNLILHCIRNRQNNTLYQRGMIFIADGWIWLVDSASGGTTGANTTPYASAQPHSVGQSITDGTVTAVAVYQYFSSTAQWFWLNVDRTFRPGGYGFPDSHDSYASTAIRLTDRVCRILGDTTWLDVASPHAGMTYFEVLEEIATFNLVDAIGAESLTDVFQDGIYPANGSPFVAYYLEDNCESYSGLVAMADLYNMRGDGVTALTYYNPDYLSTLTAPGYANVVAGGLYGLLDFTYNLPTYVYGTAVAPFATNANVNFYPFLQAMLFLELHQVEGIPQYVIQNIRYFASTNWPEYWADKSKDILPQCFIGLMAAKYWQDPLKAQQAFDIVDRYIIAANSMQIHEYGMYLGIKDRMVPPANVLKATDDTLYLENTDRSIKSIMGLPADATTGLPLASLLNFVDRIGVFSATLNMKTTTDVLMGTTAAGKGRFMPLYYLMHTNAADTVSANGQLGIGVAAPDYADVYLTAIDNSQRTVNKVYLKTSENVTTLSIAASTAIYATPHVAATATTFGITVYLFGLYES